MAICNTINWLSRRLGEAESSYSHGGFSPVRRLIQNWSAVGAEYLIHSAPTAMNLQGDEVHRANATVRLRVLDVRRCRLVESPVVVPLGSCRDHLTCLDWRRRSSCTHLDLRKTVC